jgi:DNA-binding response OmpR family regulator
MAVTQKIGTAKILVIDDEPQITEIIETFLTNSGHQVFVNNVASEGLKRAKAIQPDIILLDLMMPGLNGFDVLKQIREKFIDKWRPVIIVSGQGDLETTKKCYNLEADHYLAKPCSIDVVLKGIRTMISLIPQRLK